MMIIKNGGKGREKWSQQIMAIENFVIRLWQMLNSLEIREMLLDHSIGLGNAYYRPTAEQCLLEYLQVVDDLTINEENRLQKQLQQFKEHDDYQKYFIEKKISDLTSKLSQYEEIKKAGL